MKTLIALLVLVALFTLMACGTEEVEVTREIEVTREVEITSEPVASIKEATIPGTEVRSLHSSVVDQDYTIQVAVPLGYSTSGKTYPVAYVTDGDPRFGLTVGAVNPLSLGEGLPELIVVRIGYGIEWEPASVGKWERLRTRDLTPTNDKSYSGGGGAGKFLSFIQEELIPFIDTNYRTDSADRTIVGHSFGGLFALYALFHAPETFNRYIAMSPSLFWDDWVTFEYEEEFAKNHSELPVKLFLSAGRLEGDEYPEDLANLEEFHGKLENRNYAGLEAELVIFEDETHISVIPAATSRGFMSVFP